MRYLILEVNNGNKWHKYPSFYTANYTVQNTFNACHRKTAKTNFDYTDTHKFVISQRLYKKIMAWTLLTL